MKQQINEIRRMQQLAGILKEGRQSDEYYTSKEVIEQALRAENIKFEELPVFYDSTTPAGDNDEIEKINLYIPDGGINIDFNSASEVTVSSSGTGDEENFDLDTPPNPVGDIIRYIKQLQNQ